MNDKDQKWAIFWCSLLQPVIFEEIESQEHYRFLKNLAQKKVLFPDGELKKPALSTLKRKLKAYRSGGFQALARKRRSDRGKVRAHKQAVIDEAIDVKRDLPTRSHIAINKFLQEHHNTKVPKSTLYRHLKHAGATRIKLCVDKKKVRRRWTRDRTHALWIGDFEEGPYVFNSGQVVPTHLSAFIDCHSRYILEGRYYFRQNLDILIDSFLRALSTHGTPLSLYVDQAKVYQSNALKSACYELKIQLIFRGAGDPPPGGLIEKFFNTTQSQFETEVRAGKILTLDQLNRAFAAWLEISYHKEVNAETGQTPGDRYDQGLTVIRRVDLETVLQYFMRRVKRTVHPDFSDVQLYNKFYRVDKRFRKDKVEVRYDPYSSMDTVQIYSLEGEFLCTGNLHNRETGENPSPPAGKKEQKYNYLDLLMRKHEEKLRANTQGIDYRKTVSKRYWPFNDFVVTFARLLGRKGGLSAFSTQELEILKNNYNRLPRLTKPLLVEAFESARDKSILAILYQLQVYKRKE